MIVKMNQEGEEIQLPTAGKLQEMAGIKQVKYSDRDVGDEDRTDKVIARSSDVPLRDEPVRPPLADRVREEAEVFVNCVKYLRGELNMSSDTVYEYALRILMIDRL